MYSKFNRNISFSILPSRFNCRQYAKDRFNFFLYKLNISKFSYQSKNFSNNDAYSIPFILVKSRPYEFFQRDAIRQTYGQQIEKRFVFVLGRLPQHDQVDASVLLEALTYGDILQTNILDTYFNLGQKSYAALHWIENYCPNEKFYLMVLIIHISIYITIYLFHSFRATQMR